MALLSRLQWWTVEYGLIGDLANPKIYGAGLLSSIGESASCMQPDVKKIIYTIDALNYGYDITKQQPQLFVTPTFQNLIDVLEQFESKMAFRVGGIESVLKAVECKNICTASYSSGLQVSGVFSKVYKCKDGKIKYINTNGPTSLSYNYKQLVGHDNKYHAAGFGSPVGNLVNSSKNLEQFTEQDLLEKGIEINKNTVLNFENGVVVEGKLIAPTFKDGVLVLLTFSDCTVKDLEGNIYFEPAWGIFDMAVGAAIISVFNGAADKNSTEDQLYVSTERTYQQNYTAKDIMYQSLFKKIRDIRELGHSNGKLIEIWEAIKSDFKEDWLGALELLELADLLPVQEKQATEIRAYLIAQVKKYPKFSKLIIDGVSIIDAKLKFE
jgi:phenylalanine-4-hydroxylase